MAGSEPKIRAEHVLIIGVDGMGGMFLEKALSELPHISRLIAGGVSTMRARTVFPSVSAPAWAAVLTSQGPVESGIMDNDWTPSPHWTDADMDLAAIGDVKSSGGIKSGIEGNMVAPSPDGPPPCKVMRAMPSVSGLGTIPETMWTVAKSAWADGGIEGRSCAALGWDWIHYLCGDCDKLCREGPDSKAVAAMAKLIREPGPRQLMFVHLDDVDNVGHADGWGSEPYYAAMRDADRHIGLLLTALADAGIAERTLVVVIADHGGVGHNHGGFSQAELYVPFIAAGAGVVQGVTLAEEVAVSLLDVAPTALCAMGIAPGKHMRGRIVSEIWSS